MSHLIDTPEEYHKLFSEDMPFQKIERNKSEKKATSIKARAERAFECALDIRKFEIEMYWKRAGYFWLLTSLAFTGYFSLVKDAENLPFTILICFMGTIVTFGWYCANRGSKFWQENWEKHLDMLEDQFAGPIYKLTLIPRKKFINLLGEYNFSVSRVNQALSFFLFCVWFLLLIVHSLVFSHVLPSYAMQDVVVYLITISPLGALFISMAVGAFSVRETEGHPRERLSDKIKFCLRESPLKNKTD